MMPLLATFERICIHYPQHQALILSNTSYSYDQIARRIAAWYVDLQTTGLTPRDRIVVALHDQFEFIAIWFAVWQLGAIPIPVELPVALTGLERVLSASGATRVLSDEPALGNTPSTTGCHPSIVQPTCIYIYYKADITVSLPDDTALLFYTSGTTGLPKCVAHSHTSMAANILSLTEQLGLSKHDVALTPLTLALPATLATVALPVLCRGGSLVLPEQTIPGQVLNKIIATGTTVFFAVPYFYELLCSGSSARRGTAWNNVRLCLSSSAERSTSLFDRFYALTGHPIRSVYCTSEAGACTFNNSHDMACVRASVGQPLPGVMLQIVDDTGCSLPAGQEGQILIGGAHIASGYVGQPAFQAAVFNDGWVCTGDIGQCDTDGYLYLTGRQSDTINVSGFLVQPREVEAVLLRHPAVAEVLVYSQPDSKRGELVAAQVVLQNGVPIPSKELLLRYCATTLPHYKIPRTITFVDRLPKGRYGKVKRPYIIEEK